MIYIFLHFLLQPMSVCVQAAAHSLPHTVKATWLILWCVFETEASIKTTRCGPRITRRMCWGCLHVNAFLINAHTFVLLSECVWVTVCAYIPVPAEKQGNSSVQADVCQTHVKELLARTLKWFSRPITRSACHACCGGYPCQCVVNTWACKTSGWLNVQHSFRGLSATGEL